MMSLNTRFKAAVLAVSLLAVGQGSAVSLQTTLGKISMPKKLAIVGFAAGLIRLWTKGGAWDYKTADWKNDLKDLMEELNIFDIKLYKKLVALIDKYIIGRAVSLIDVTTRTKNDNGEVISAKRKRCDVKPFGVLGLFDAYVLLQLEKLGKISEGCKSADNFFGLFADTPKTENNNIKVTTENNNIKVTVDVKAVEEK